MENIGTTIFGYQNGGSCNERRDRTVAGTPPVELQTFINGERLCFIFEPKFEKQQ